VTIFIHTGAKLYSHKHCFDCFERPNKLKLHLVFVKFSQPETCIETFSEKSCSLNPCLLPHMSGPRFFCGLQNFEPSQEFAHFNAIFVCAEFIGDLIAFIIQFKSKFVKLSDKIAHLLISTVYFSNQQNSTATQKIFPQLMRYNQ